MLADGTLNRRLALALREPGASAMPSL